MRGILKYIIILSAICSIFHSCAFNEDLLYPDSSIDNGSRILVASVENFSRHNVSTKATDDEERKVKEVAVLIYGTDAQGARVLITGPLYFDHEVLSFVINTTDTGRGRNQGTNITEQYISGISDEPHSFEAFADAGGNLEACTIYVVANMNTIISGNEDVIRYESGFKSLSYTLQVGDYDNAGPLAVSVPEGGLPMVGSEVLDLRYNSDNTQGSEQSEQVLLKALFAKINVRFRVQVVSEDNPGDMGNVQTPFFKPTSWRVYNIPEDVSIEPREPLQNPGNETFTTEPFNNFTFGPDSRSDNKVDHSTSVDEYVEFSFYMPEYLLKAGIKPEDAYPSELHDEELSQYRQYYKPKLCTDTQKPTYVEVVGKFSDYQGYPNTVTYRMYLGQNETDDFQIKRNQELNNTALIRGIEKHKDGIGEVTVDHRVEITSTGYSIAMERETRLDSHFEFRPMDISLTQGDVLVVTIPKVDEQGNPINRWFGAEVHNEANTGLKYDPAKPGLRRYFTDGLMTELGANSSTEIKYVLRASNSSVEDYKKIWFYFDENLSHYDASQPDSETNKLFREGYVTVDYYTSRGDGGKYAYKEDGTGTPKESGRKFTFRQMGLWVINPTKEVSADLAAKRPDKFLIEYFEEYLYNYAADENYGNTTDGIKWGLNSQNFSFNQRAVYADPQKMDSWLGEVNINEENFFNTAFEKVDVKYDFYLTRDFETINTTLLTPNDYSGLQFTKTLTELAEITKKQVTLSQKSGEIESAVEYCFNKNKRNDVGEVETINWYLPAIDETEEILVDGFNYFPVFQSKFYWSSQPAFKRIDYEADATELGFITLGNATGYYYRDDTNRARATRVTATVSEEDSGVKASEGKLNIRIYDILGWTIVNPGNEQLYREGDENYVSDRYHPGNISRNETHRVRCAYSPNGVDSPHTPYPLVSIFGDWNVRVASSNSNSSNQKDLVITISESDNASKGNVMLNRYPHWDDRYNSTEYPIYATYNTETGVLTIPMSQKIGEHSYTYRNNQTRTSDITSRVFYNNNYQSSSFTLQYNDANASFTVSNSSYGLSGQYTWYEYNRRGDITHTDPIETSYIKSFSRVQ